MVSSDVRMAALCYFIYLLLFFYFIIIIIFFLLLFFFFHVTYLQFSIKCVIQCIFNRSM